MSSFLGNPLIQKRKKKLRFYTTQLSINVNQLIISWMIKLFSFFWFDLV